MRGHGCQGHIGGYSGNWTAPVQLPSGVIQDLREIGFAAAHNI